MLWDGTCLRKGQVWQSCAPVLLLLLSVPKPKHPISSLLSRLASWCMWRHNSDFILEITVFVSAVLLCIYTWVVPQFGKRTGEQGGTLSVLSCFGARQPLGLFFQTCTSERPIKRDSRHGDEHEVFVCLRECMRKKRHELGSPLAPHGVMLCKLLYHLL